MGDVAHGLFWIHKYIHYQTFRIKKMMWLLNTKIKMQTYHIYNIEDKDVDDCITIIGIIWLALVVVTKWQNGDDLVGAKMVFNKMRMIPLLDVSF